MNQYSINVVWSDEDNCFIATVPEFPGLSAFGDTKAEALKEAEIALCGFIEIHKEKKIELPTPQKVKEFSGQIRIRIPKSLHGKLSEFAQGEGVSLNTLIVSLLSGRFQSELLNSKLDKLESMVIGTLFTSARQPRTSSANVIRKFAPEMQDWDCQNQ